MTIEWNKVTWYSWVAAIVIFVGTFWIGFYLGRLYEYGHTAPLITEISQSSPAPMGALTPRGSNIINDVVFACPDGKNIHAIFYTSRTVALNLSDGRSMTLPQTISASGARYANANESFVFWNKGDGAFIEENGTTTYKDCVIKPSGR